MAVDRRQKNAEWRVLDEAGRVYSGRYDASMLAVLMDIRDELQAMNRILQCPNFVGIPTTLRSIRRNTAKPRTRTVAKKGSR